MLLINYCPVSYSLEERLHKELNKITLDHRQKTAFQEETAAALLNEVSRQLWEEKVCLREKSALCVHKSFAVS